MTSMCNICAEKSKQRLNKRRYLLKMDALAAYGMKCANCGINDINALTIDHVNGGGEQHRKRLNVHGGAGFYAWLKKNKYPDGYQTLCWNCNYLKFCGEIETNTTTMSVKNRYKFNVKSAVFSAYGGAQCCQCGEKRFQLLTIDHINGRQLMNHARTFTGTDIYVWLKHHNYPSGFQVLCFNCNCTKSVKQILEPSKMVGGY